MDNLELYNKWREVPQTAQRTISGGNLNGKTDINPMWRIKVLTEAFGPVGFGWYTRIAEHWSDEQTIDGKTEVVAWVRVELFVKQGGEWSAPIEGVGGSKYAGKGRGSELNDEAFKMAETDAISVACKKLGIGADIYWQKDNTKYTQQQGQQQQRQQAPATNPNYKPITVHPNDVEWRDWLLRQAAAGCSREACEQAANAQGRTVPRDIWQKALETL